MQGGSGCIATGVFSIYNVPTEECDAHVMVKWDQVTGGICVDGCSCPMENIIEVGLRKITLDDRNIEGKAYIGDSQYTCTDLPVGYIYPTDPDVPYYQNLFTEENEYAFGISTSTRPANRVCTEHFNPAGPVVPTP